MKNEIAVPFPNKYRNLLICRCRNWNQSLVILTNSKMVEVRVAMAEGLFKKMIEGELSEPGALICNKGSSYLALVLHKIMDGNDCKPDVTYNTIIGNLCNCKMVEDALKFFKGIVFWKSILPDVGVCNSLIYGVCSLCRCDEVSNMLKEMEDEVLYILTNAYCKEYVIEDVEVVINLTSLDKRRILR